MRRASASPAACARLSSPVRSSVALVATTASVVLREANGAPPRPKCVKASTNVPSAARAPARIAPEPSRLLSTAFRLPPGSKVEVEDHRGRYDGHDAGRSHGQAPPPFPQPAHHAVRRAETVGRAAGEQDRVDAVDQVAGVQRVELACSRGAASDG